jgi:hypothetical protein
MHVCDKRRAATEYALLSAIFGFTRSVAGGFSGWGTTHLGYAAYFGVTFLLALPALALLPWVKPWADAVTATASGQDVSAPAEENRREACNEVKPVS